MKYTPKIIEQLIKCIEAGSNVATACRAVGISRNTFYEWLNDEEKSDISYTIIQKVEARAILRNIIIIQKAAKKNWTAAAWFLERKDFKNWGKKDKLAPETPKALKAPPETKQGIEFRREIKKLTPEQRKIFIKWAIKMSKVEKDFMESNGDRKILDKAEKEFMKSNSDNGDN